VIITDEAVLKSASTITASARYINSPRSFFYHISWKY